MATPSRSVLEQWILILTCQKYLHYGSRREWGGFPLESSKLGIYNSEDGTCWLRPFTVTAQVGVNVI